jgi:LPS-assembly protein
MAISTTARPVRVHWKRRSGTVAPSVILLLIFAACFAPQAALAQAGPSSQPNSGFLQTWVGVPSQPPAPVPKDPNAQMLVKADELHYDYANNRVTAVGNVQIYYNGTRLEANNIVYDQQTK